MEYDLIIVGMGIAGVSSAIYAQNNGLNILMIDKNMPGGLLNKINTINNYPGFNKITGPDLALNLFNIVNERNIPYKILEVKKILIEEDKKIVETDTEKFIAKKIIIATGRNTKKLGLEFEKELLGNGISTCAICDGHLFKDKEIAIIGGGNSAVEEAIYLSNIVKKIYMIHRRDKFSASDSLVKELNNKNNIEYIWNSNITSLIEDNNKLSGIVVNSEKQINVSGLFVYIGFEPNVDFISNLGIVDSKGYIKVDKNYETDVKGVYAVGDAIKKDVYQLITAASDGAIASINVYKCLNK